MNKTIDYYNQNADAFVSGTIDVKFTDVQDKFLSYLPFGAYILDFGCGSGRDTKYFLSKGLQVDATDGSEKLCKIAEKVAGIPVKRMLFSELGEVEKYDGIWACSSILHLPKDELKGVMVKMIRATKNSGYIYTSFKYGESVYSVRYQLLLDMHAIDYDNHTATDLSCTICCGQNWW